MCANHFSQRKYKAILWCFPKSLIISAIRTNAAAPLSEKSTINNRLTCEGMAFVHSNIQHKLSIQSE